MTVTVGKGRATHEASAVVSHRTVCGKVWTDVAEIGRERVMTDIAVPTREEQRKALADKIAKDLGQAVNGMLSYADLGEALANEHPTLLGQIAKGLGVGVVRRSDYNPDWRPWDKFTRPLCTIDRSVNYSEFSDKAWEHPEHDGRLDCSTVVGAILLARQSYI